MRTVWLSAGVLAEKRGDHMMIIPF